MLKTIGKRSVSGEGSLRADQNIRQKEKFTWLNGLGKIRIGLPYIEKEIVTSIEQGINCFMPLKLVI